MAHSKSRAEGRLDRLRLLKDQFPAIEWHINNGPPGVSVDDLLDAAVVAWTGLRIWHGVAESVCMPGWDGKGLSVCIHY